MMLPSPLPPLHIGDIRVSHVVIHSSPSLPFTVSFQQGTFLSLRATRNLNAAVSQNSQWMSMPILLNDSGRSKSVRRPSLQLSYRTNTAEQSWTEGEVRCLRYLSRDQGREGMIRLLALLPSFRLHRDGSPRFTHCGVALRMLLNFGAQYHPSPALSRSLSKRN